MARWKYSPLAQDESGKTVQNKDQTYDPEGENDSKMINQRMPYCLGIMVLLAIVYVLSRTENVGADCPTIAGGVSFEDFDIGAYRSKALANTPPHIIECKEAEEGASQDICHISREKRFAALGQKGVTLWMAGLSGSGKSTIRDLPYFNITVLRTAGDDIVIVWAESNVEYWALVTGN